MCSVYYSGIEEFFKFLEIVVTLYENFFSFENFSTFPPVLLIRYEHETFVIA